MSLNQFPRRSFVGSSTLQTFTGDGTDTTFTLSSEQTQNECFVFVDDVVQVPGVDFTVNGTILTFTVAPANTAEIIVRGFGVPAPITTVSDGSITHSKLASGAIEAKLGYTPVSAAIVASQLATLVDSAPSTLDTLNELAAALGDDANFATTVTNALATKATTTYVDNQIAAIQVTPTQISDKTNSSTGYLDLPSGTTAQRPASPSTGMCRFNTTTNFYEFYDGSSWVNLALPYNIDYLAIAGGGSGGNGFSNTTGTTGGGGAGGYITGNNVLLTPGQTYTITIGAGATGVQQSSGSSTFGNSGNNTAISGTSISITAIGGGRGGFDTSGPGGSGGSGGGGGSSNAAGGSATSGQGNNGSAGGSPAGGGGGGGAGSAGGAPTNSGGGGTSGAGGNGLAWLDGITRAGGGGGGGAFNTSPIIPGAGGSGGGTAGGVARSSGGTAGGPGVGTISSNNATANTGSGSGGGGSQDATGASSGSGNGGSGVVIIRYVGNQRASGGAVTSSGGYTIHTFTSSGTYTA